MSLLVSVVVPTCHRRQLLGRCLQALVAQSFPPQAYEIIIVDDGLEDGGTRELVAEWQQRLRASYAFLAPPLITAVVPVTGATDLQNLGLQNLDLQNLGQQNLGVTYQVKTSPIQQPRILYRATSGRCGPAAARNLGWKMASGEIIAFTDDDCIPEPDWLSNGLSAFVDGVAGVSGRTVVPLPQNPTDYELNATALQRSDFITANCFYRRKVLEEVGGFDERFATAWREDSDLYFTIRERNYSLAWASGAVVVHPVRPEKWGSSLRQQRKSFYNALLYKKHPQLYWRYIQPAPPWHYYAMLVAVLAAGTGLVLAKPLLAGAGGLTWLYLVSWFTFRRLKQTTHTPAHVTEMILTSLLIPFISVYWRLRGAVHWRVLFL
jgi:cellulose synthase/poly-beta-1,6-N-acetylglucosamine synthase-like glycosyltransferase